MRPDIREVLSSLDEADKRLWLQHRTEMRRSFLTAHNAVLGINAWDNNDDAFLDLIDIRLALLFDKSGRVNSTKIIATEEDAAKITKVIMDQNGKRDEAAKSTYDPKEVVEPSDATKMMQAWPTSGAVK